MASLFTRIIDGELPGRFVWKDEHCVAFLSIAPVRPGHVLVVPRAEIDHWIDCPPALAAHLMTVSRTLGEAIQKVFRPEKVALTILGLEVRHTHLHLVPIRTEADMRFANADENAKPEDMDAAAESIRTALREAGCAEVAG
ncbi:MAG: HIT family protein [Planctomycetota bacterium]|nr:MAG: HIT family protein [Planctomycetota bacterium]